MSFQSSFQSYLQRTHISVRIVSSEEAMTIMEVTEKIGLCYCKVGTETTNGTKNVIDLNVTADELAEEIETYASSDEEYEVNCADYRDTMTAVRKDEETADNPGLQKAYQKLD